MEHCGLQQILKNVDVTYTYDETTKTVTAIMKVGGGGMSSVTMTYTGKSFKVSSDSIKGSSDVEGGRIVTLTLIS